MLSLFQGTILYWINPFIFNPVIIVYKITSDVLWEIGRGTEKSGLPEVEGTGVNPSSSGIQHGKPLIKQGDPQWAEIPYKNPNCGDESQTIKSSGCGIASLAMAIAYYNSTSEREYKNLITTLANDAVYELKVRTCNNGTAWSIYTNNKYLKKMECQWQGNW
ncbi:MAG: hypothetical protein KatS3mg095_0352 [Candidatus Parcubacteria bacterium]|nr:MAG: hypothetical protein KatS3mg095_0352 [Candidatus Parcubacteria bacterium]